MRLLAIFLLIGIPGQLCAEPPEKLPVLSTHLRHAARIAGVIFSGSVLSVERGGAEGERGKGVTRITFRVEQAIRGVRRGQVLQVSEWAGLWNGGERYRTGERVLLFLYPNSKLGLTSPVGGAMGRFAMDGPTRVLLNPTEDHHLKPHPIEVHAFTEAIRRVARE